jgi:hypothetical protein
MKLEKKNYISKTQFITFERLIILPIFDILINALKIFCNGRNGFFFPSKWFLVC